MGKLPKTIDNFNSDSSQNWVPAHLGRVFFARFFDIVISSVPMLIVFIFYRVVDSKTALIAVSSGLLTIFLYFNIVPLFFKGKTLAKLMFGLKIIHLENKKITFKILFIRELYFLYIPLLFQLLCQIAAVSIFLLFTSDGEENANLMASTTSFILQRIGYAFYVGWFLYLLITIYLQVDHIAAIDLKLKIRVLHTIKVYNEPNIKKETHIHLENKKPGIINLEELNFIQGANMFKNSCNAIETMIEEKYFSGAVFCVSKNKEQVFLKSFGINDVKENTPMNENLIFRAYSMTKPVTVIAFLRLVDAGIVSIDDEISKFLPVFKSVNVLQTKTSENVVPLSNPITFKHLLTMTAGFTYHGNKNKTQILTSEFLKNYVVGENGKYWNYDDFCTNLSKIPLLFQPGTDWNYGLEIDVLAAAIEKITNQSFRDHLKDTLFKDLGMSDSDFYLFDKSREAFVNVWNTGEDGNTLRKRNNFKYLSQEIDKVPNAPMGGAGLFTTATDYNKFLNFLLDGKNSEGQQLISEKLLNEMCKDQLGALKKSFIWTLNADYSYGYGVRVRIDNNESPLTEIGEFGWDGLLGSASLVDKKNNITMNIMLSSFPGHNKKISTEFFEAFYKDVK